jgi:hypothetical protein
MFPNPAEAFTNPVRYWSDVVLFQAEISRQAYEVACMMNPCLPRIAFTAGIAARAPNSSRPVSSRDGQAPSARPLPLLALPERPVTARPAPPCGGTSTTRKTVVTLAPGLPPSKLFDGN